MSLRHLDALDTFAEHWDKKYPRISQSWRDNWPNLSTYFKYPQEVRRLIYTTNTIEGFNRQLRKVTKAKSVFPTDDSLLKRLYLGHGVHHEKVDWPPTGLEPDPCPVVDLLFRPHARVTLLESEVKGKCTASPSLTSVPVSVILQTRRHRTKPLPPLIIFALFHTCTEFTQNSDNPLSYGDDHLLVMHQPMMSCRLSFYEDMQLIAGSGFFGDGEHCRVSLCL